MINPDPIKTSVKLVKNDINNIKTSCNSNVLCHLIMTAAKFTALNELVHNLELMIKPDKGGAVVIIDTIKYVAEASRQMGDSNVYRVLYNNL